MRINHFLGGVFLIAGTAIGAGMLALPITTSFAGFIPTLGVLLICWLYLTSTAFLILEVNLSLKGETNLVSMAQKTLGTFGKVLSWSVYLLLLYALTSAYLAGSAPFFQLLFRGLGVELPWFLAPLVFLVFLGTFVYFGTRSVDLINRFFIFGLILSYFFLIFFLPKNVQPDLLKRENLEAIFLGVPIIITSFGFHIVIPTLVTYMNHNARRLRLAIFIGSLIPLIVYILWEFLILGILPLQGENGLVTSAIRGEPVTVAVAKELHNSWIGVGAQLFSFFAIVTSFLGVSLSLSDFLADGLKTKKMGKHRLAICFLTFFPPLLFVWFYQQAFILALQYAAIFVAILLGILPVLMAWNTKRVRFFQKVPGKFFLMVLLLFSFFIIFLDLVQDTTNLENLLHKYLQ